MESISSKFTPPANPTIVLISINADRGKYWWHQRKCTDATPSAVYDKWFSVLSISYTFRRINYTLYRDH